MISYGGEKKCIWDAESLCLCHHNNACLTWCSGIEIQIKNLDGCWLVGCYFGVRHQKSSNWATCSVQSPLTKRNSQEDTGRLHFGVNLTTRWLLSPVLIFLRCLKSGDCQGSCANNQICGKRKWHFIWYKVHILSLCLFVLFSLYRFVLYLTMTYFNLITVLMYKMDQKLQNLLRCVILSPLAPRPTILTKEEI